MCRAVLCKQYMQPGATLKAARLAACRLPPCAAGFCAPAVFALAMLLTASAADIADSLLRLSQDGNDAPPAAARATIGAGGGASPPSRCACMLPTGL